MCETVCNTLLTNFRETKVQTFAVFYH